MSSPLIPNDEIFISYAHIDNQTLPGQTRGWVTNFHDALAVLLGEKLGESPLIWRDNKLSPNQRISATILNKLSEIAVMISILSPRYAQSESCHFEVEEFCKAAESNLGISVEERSRIIKVLKTPLGANHGLPEVFTDLDLGGYKFYKEGEEEPREFRLEFGPEGYQNFLLKVDDISREIVKVLLAIRTLKAEQDAQGDAQPLAAARTSAAEAAGASAPIFLATTPDLDTERDSIKRDLEQRGYVVLPDESKLSREAGAFERQVREDVSRSQLSIHLIGRKYGDCPRGSERSYMHLQNDIAAERDGDPSFSRLVWMPKRPSGAEANTEEAARAAEMPPDIRHRRLVTDLLNFNSGGATDLLRTSLEDFKTVILDRLNADGAPSPPTRLREGRDLIYLIYDALDAGPAARLEKYLSRSGRDVMRPKLTGSESDILKDHQGKLSICDAAVCVWDKAPEYWLRTKLREIEKSHGYGRSEPLAVEAVYVCGERTEEKERFYMLEVIVIKDFAASEAAPPPLGPFTEALDRAKGGRANEKS